MRSWASRCSVAVFVLTAVFGGAGCGGDGDHPVKPTTRVGTVAIDVEPDNLDAPWELAGPDSYSRSGTGDLTISDLAEGDYTVTWGAVSGWIRPSDSAKTLTAGGTLNFSGIYSQSFDPIEGYVLIPPISASMPTTYTMGSEVEENETPHQVTLTRRYYMHSTEVTNGQYVAALQWAYDQGHVTVTSSNVLDALDGSEAGLLGLGHPDAQIEFQDGVFSSPSPNRPATMVTWHGAAAYCDWLSLQAGRPRAYDHSDWSCNGGDPYDAPGFRLPTEAEWEFACRAGTTTPFHTGDCLEAGTEANYDGDAPYDGCPAGPDLQFTVDVGGYPPNPWGLFNMHGNAFEWCQDWWSDYDGDATDPVGAESTVWRSIRGGGFGVGARSCRSAKRHTYYPSQTGSQQGFRTVLSAR